MASSTFEGILGADLKRSEVIIGRDKMFILLVASHNKLSWAVRLTMLASMQRYHKS